MGLINEKRDYLVELGRNLVLSLGEAGNEEGQENVVYTRWEESSINVVV